MTIFVRFIASRQHAPSLSAPPFFDPGPGGGCAFLHPETAELAVTQVPEPPLTGRAYFGPAFHENLDLGNPRQVQLIFNRRSRTRLLRVGPAKAGDFYRLANYFRAKWAHDMLFNHGKQTRVLFIFAVAIDRSLVDQFFQMRRRGPLE